MDAESEVWTTIMPAWGRRRRPVNEGEDVD